MTENVVNKDNLRDLCFLGFVDIDNTIRPFGLLPDDRRRHIYILGKSGMGKSTLLENMVLQDIYTGKGVAFIDPLGDSAESIIDRIPPYRLQDVIYFNPADTNYPIGLNMLETTGGSATTQHLISANIMSVVQRLWAGTWSARMEYILVNTILALLDTPGNSMLGILKMFSDKQFRKYISEKTQNLLVRNFWLEEFPNFPAEYKVEAVAAIQNKIGQLFSNELIRNILGQQASTIDFRQIMDEGKIFIANLSKGQLGENNSSILGGMLVTKFQLAAMSRSDQMEEKRKDFYLYIDEFQNLLSDSFETILSEARKYRLNLTFGNQYLGQLRKEDDDKIIKAIFGNVGTIVSFQIGAEDAKTLGSEMMPLDEDAIANFLKLHRGQIISRIFIQGESTESFFANTIAPMFTEFGGAKQHVIEASRKQFSRPKNVVEKMISDYYTQSLVVDGDTGETTKVKKPKRKRKRKNKEGETFTS